MSAVPQFTHFVSVFGSGLNSDAFAELKLYRVPIIRANGSVLLPLQRPTLQFIAGQASLNLSEDRTKLLGRAIFNELAHGLRAGSFEDFKWTA